MEARSQQPTPEFLRNELARLKREKNALIMAH